MFLVGASFGKRLAFGSSDMGRSRPVTVSSFRRSKTNTIEKKIKKKSLFTRWTVIHFLSSYKVTSQSFN